MKSHYNNFQIESWGKGAELWVARPIQSLAPAPPASPLSWPASLHHMWGWVGGNRILHKSLQFLISSKSHCSISSLQIILQSIVCNINELSVTTHYISLHINLPLPLVHTEHTEHCCLDTIRHYWVPELRPAYSGVPGEVKVAPVLTIFYGKKAGSRVYTILKMLNV